MKNPIDENDDFFISPKEANSRSDCPHEIGSKEWLEWQRNFAWEEYTKPTGQERIEAAYKRLADRGFKVVDRQPFYPIQGRIDVVFLTYRWTWF